MTFKQIQGKISYFLVKTILLLTRIIPLKWSYSICTFAVFVGSRIRWSRIKIAMKNLEIVFPEKTPAEREIILRESLRKMLKGYFETAYFMNGVFPKDRILNMASATGLENLDSVMNQGRGAILYSGHFGNFFLMLLWLAFRGYPMAAVYKEASNLPDEFFGNLMRKFNITPLKYKSDAALTISIIKALKEGKIVLIQNDQSHPNGVYINFFNKTVPSPGGPALLANRVGVPLIPAYIRRTKEDNHLITVLPEMALIPETDHEKFLVINTQQQIDWIAEILVKHPCEWLWLHNRWKRAKN